MRSKQQSIQENSYTFPYHYLDLKSDEHKYILHLEYKAYLDLVKQELRPFQGQLILDAGCGDGRFCFEMSKENVQIRGVDFSSRAVTWARMFNPGIAFDAQDLKELQLPQLCDAICLIETMEHLPPEDISKVMAGLARNLKEDGKLIITVPSVNMPLIDKHYQHFTIDTLKELTGEHFTILKSYGTTVSNWKTKLFYLVLEFCGLLFCLRRRIPAIKKLFEFMADVYDKHLKKGTLDESKRIVAVLCKKGSSSAVAVDQGKYESSSFKASVPRGEMQNFLINEFKGFWYRHRFRLTIGRGTKVSRKAILKNVDGGTIRIGDFCHIHDYAIIASYGGSVTIGNHSTVNFHTVLYGHGGLTIGNGVRIGAHVVVIPANHNFEDMQQMIMKQGITCKGIVIEDDVWIGAGVSILDGVRVGRGSIIGAGAVVTNDIPEYAVAVGNPARVIRYRGQKHKA